MRLTLTRSRSAGVGKLFAGFVAIGVLGYFFWRFMRSDNTEL